MTDLDAIMIIEGGDATLDELVEAFQQLIDSGTVWQLQGSYGRAAEHLIANHYCYLKEEI